MSQSLLLNCDDGSSIGVVRNPFERVISEYYASINYIGLDAWLAECPLKSQVELYKNCDYLITFDTWETDLELWNLHPKDTSILESVKVIPMWNRWYTLKTRTLVARIYKDDITTFGYSY